MSGKPYHPSVDNKKVFFPKKSHHGYFDETFQRRFNSEREKRNFMNNHGFVEKGEASREHVKRVKDFAAHCKNERSKNPNFKYKGDYPT